ncbi:amino acid adenylation domain-containing protein [Paenibacillus marchantiae]|uniref:non-ribosomal peptide synthetase n=1 Tax=Paenibacillus marchantiae TaxID=3026433 RepID=UPI00237B128C|nr:non-ribosomal peptide synthetase [Paenibacillus marchantiae]WDQ32173.1 amino acid adenylation domain-containing protein [Paenibacillus marchantiae]
MNIEIDEQSKRELIRNRLLKKNTEGGEKKIKKRTSHENLPLSFAQQRLWFLHRLEEDETANYNIVFAWMMKGQLNKVAFHQCFKDVIDRHEILRTTFTEVEGVPYQSILKEIDFTIQVDNVTDLPYNVRTERALEIAQEESKFCFSLTKGPLIRARLVEIDNNHVLFILNMHHIIADGWSIGVLTKEITENYNSYINNRKNVLPKLDTQYADFSIWQRERVHNKNIEMQLNYWKHHLSGKLPILNLPTDFQRPNRQSFRGKVRSFNLSNQILTDLKRISRTEGATLFMVLTAALNILLFRYSGQTDILMGTPVANRNNKEIENLIGFFVNTLIIRTDLSNNPSFKEVTQRIKKVALDAYLNQDVPFEKLVEVLQPDRDLSQIPLFRVMFALQNASMPPLELSNLDLESIEIYNDTSKFDLFINAYETVNGMNISIEYSTDLFKSSTIERFTMHFKNLLVSIVQNPYCNIADLPIISNDENDKLLNEWNMTLKHFNRRNYFVHTLIEEKAKQIPTDNAISFNGEHLTYYELNNKANALASKLRELNCVPGTFVGIYMERSIEMMISLLAILKAGGAYVPLDPTYPQERLKMIIEDINLPIILTKTHSKQNISLENVFNVDFMDDVKIEDNIENSIISLDNNIPAYVIYTSGSTGKPKGIVMSHRALVNLLLWQENELDKIEELRTLQFTSLNFDVSFQEIFSTWLSGGTLVLIEDDKRRDPELLINHLINNKVTRLFLPFVALKQLTETSNELKVNTYALEQVITAGEQLQLTDSIRGFFENRPSITLYNHYGPSETHVVTSYKLPPDTKEWTFLPPIGKPINNVKIYILDANLKLCPIGVPGELYIAGAALSDGYINRPDMTDERFIKDDYSHSKDSLMYKTGDLVRLLEDGNIQYLGRMDSQVKIRGYRVELGEIEEVLDKYEFINESVVLLSEDKEGNNFLVAFVVTVNNYLLNEGDLRYFLNRHLPSYMVPSKYVKLDYLPISPNGKVNRTSLLMLDDSTHFYQKEYNPPCNRKELIMTQIWEELLGVYPISIDASFFDIGGESLKAVRLIHLLNKEFNTKLPVSLLFQYPTIRSLIGSMEKQIEKGTTLQEIPDILIEMTKANGSGSPIFFVHPVGGGIFCYAPLLNSLKGETIYGIQAYGYDSEETPLDDMEQIVELYLKRIVELCPHGPYRLIGWSFGGTVAYELGKRLEKDYGTIEFLGLIDASYVGDKEQNFDIRYFEENWDETISKYTPFLPKEVSKDKTNHAMSIILANLKAYNNYLSSWKIKANIHLFRVEEISKEYPMELINPDEWGTATYGKVYDIVIPGHHHSLMQPPNVEIVGEKIKIALNKLNM